MNKLPTTYTIDSREVAKMVGKDHPHLLRDIKGYIEYMEVLGESNIGFTDFFIPTTYTSRQNKELPRYDVTKKGCEFIANKLTGQKGTQFTAAYVTRFNQMELAVPQPQQIASSDDDEKLLIARKRADAMARNSKSKVAGQLLKLWNAAGIKPEYQALALGDYYRDDGIQLPAIALQGTKVTYDKTTIADKLGILSKAGKPHAHAIGAIIAKLDISDDETERIPYCRNGHDGFDYQYTESVINKISGWLTCNGHPTQIVAPNKIYQIRYRQKLLCEGM